jgi:hypothetical protein
MKRTHLLPLAALAWFPSSMPTTRPARTTPRQRASPPCSAAGPHQLAGPVELPKRAQTRQAAAADEEMKAHWSVKDGILVFDGAAEPAISEGYGDFGCTSIGRSCQGDGGIYLRSSQVQIWANSGGGARQRSVRRLGGLFNKTTRASRSRCGQARRRERSHHHG